MEDTQQILFLGRGLYDYADKATWQCNFNK